MQKFNPTPKQIFLIDGSGALLSAFMLGISMPRFNEHIGLPSNVLNLFALFAFGFAVYSFSNAFNMRTKWKPFLKLIAVANLMYCLLTITLVALSHQTVTTLALTYFLFEVVIVSALALFELKLASN